MITIDGVEYAEKDLSEEAKVRINRILDLRKEIDRLMLNYDEVQAAISHHQNKIAESVSGSD